MRIDRMKLMFLGLLFGVAVLSGCQAAHHAAYGLGKDIEVVGAEVTRAGQALQLYVNADAASEEPSPFEQ